MRQRPRWAEILIAALVAATMVASGCARTTSSIAPSGASPLAGPSLAVPTAHAPGAASPLPDATFRPLTPEEQAAADAFAALADEHNRAVTELLIANPLAEWDLVGLPLADEVTALPDRLAGLPAPPLTHDLVTELAIAAAAIGAALAAIDPHAPRVDQATAYAQALDDWSPASCPSTWRCASGWGFRRPDRATCGCSGHRTGPVAWTGPVQIASTRRGRVPPPQCISSGVIEDTFAASAAYPR